MNPIKDIIAGITKGSAESIIKTVTDTVDKFTLSKEEKAQINQAIATELNRHAEKLEELSLQKLQAELGDIANARDNNAKIQESEKASWLAKNLPLLMDATFVVTFFIGLLMIMYKVVPEQNKELFYTGFGLLGGFVSTVVNFHRGTSSGSKASSDVLRHIVKNK